MNTFFDRNRDTLRRLFDALGKGDDWVDDPAEIAAHTLPRWLGTEHGPGARKEVFDAREIAAARPLLADLGLTQQVDPPRDRYDEVIVMGAAGIGLHRRATLVRDSGVAAEALTILAGLRPHSGLARDGGLADLLEGRGHLAGRAGWRPPPRIAHLASLLAEAGVDDMTAARIAFPDETALAELVVHKLWPKARRVGVVPVDGGHDAVNELGQRDHVMTRWDAGGGPIPTLRILNGAPVERRHGPPRPTSRSTLAEWVALVAHDRPDLSALVVVNQPHLHRVALEMTHEMAQLGRPDVAMDFAGGETLPDVSIHLLLGELPARLLVEEAG